MTPIRLAHVVSHPIPYFAPLYRELAGRPDVDLTVYFASDATLAAYRDPEFGRDIDWGVELVEGYDGRVLPSARGAPLNGRRPNTEIVGAVTRGDYDAIWAHGWTRPETVWSAFFARRNGMPFLLREEQTLLHRRSLAKRLAKGKLLRLLLDRAYGLYIGEQNRRWLAHYGVPEERLFAARYCVDNAWFRARADELEPRRAELRKRLGVGGDEPVLLFCGKLVPKKDPLTLVEAFAGLGRGRLLLVGEGPLRGEIERRTVPGVVLSGFLDADALAEAYAAADVFVLPSARDETWGLVVNEAQNFGLPAVVTEKVGCAEDLVTPGETGIVVRAGDVDALSGALDALVSDEDLRLRYGQAARQRVARYSVEACADGIVAACRAAVSR